MLTLPRGWQVPTVAGSTGCAMSARLMVAVAKPAGQPSHPLVAGERGTLANVLVARYPECGRASPDPREAGLAHRLDAGTSGANTHNLLNVLLNKVVKYSPDVVVLMEAVRNCAHWRHL